MSSITEDEMDDIKERYELFDKKGDGKVDAAQILDVLRACGLNPMATEVEKVSTQRLLDVSVINNTTVPSTQFKRMKTKQPAM